MTLDQLQPGCTAVITAVDCRDAALRTRLMDMGLIPGASVAMVRAAPLGDPLEVELWGYALALRRADAAKVVLASAPGPQVRTVDLASFPGQARSAGTPGPSHGPIRLALSGNPNCGKTTLFNLLTGANQRVGNFPGVTLDRKEGVVRGHRDVRVIDLPGIYSLSPYTGEERITAEFLRREPPDCIVNILDAACLPRSLYLTMQLLELDIPVVLALNRMDEVRRSGGSIRTGRLEEVLGVPVVPISAFKNQGVDLLLARSIRAARSHQLPPRRDFSRAAAQLGFCGGPDPAAALANVRYQFLSTLCAETVSVPGSGRERSRRIDRVLTGTYTALPILALVLALVFYVTFGPIGTGLSDLTALGIRTLSDLCGQALAAWGVHPLVRDLVTGGILAGVGSVLGFLPVIVVLFFFLAILEDSGYLARAAFLLDRPMERLGLSGRCFVPLLMGFGCSVPAIMATRTLPSDRDRKMTVLLTPFMSCSAKLPIYALLTGTFFPGHGPMAVLLLYCGGIAAGALYAALLDRTVFRGRPGPFLLELPSYRMPSVRNVLRLLWDRAKDFTLRAMTVILLTSVAVWFLGRFDLQLHLAESASESLLALLGRGVAPLFAPLGLDDWRISTALLAGLTAKESVVSTLAILLSGEDLTALFSPLSAAVFLVFCLLYTPCAAAMAAARRELGGPWAAVMAAVQCALAWLAAFLFRAVALLLF